MWSREWVCVGSVDDIPGEGDLLPFTVGNHGVHVQRMAHGLEARFNKAQHGGCRAIPLQCQTGRKTGCSFTSCGYSRDRPAIRAGEAGAAAMHQYLGLRPERLLRPALRDAGGAIFVNLNPHAPWPEDEMARMPLLHDHAGAPRSREIWREYQANWKIMASALAGDAPLHDAATRWAATAPSMEDGVAVRAVWMFPNLVLLGDGATTATAVLQPTALDQTLCRISARGHDCEAALERWLGIVAARGCAAEALHAGAALFGTHRRPETIGQPLPPQPSAAARWMQAALAGCVASAPLSRSLHARVAGF